VDAVQRILDANFNRAGEALRTIEEYARFVMDSSSLFERIKSVRHRLGEGRRRLETALGGARLSAARDILGDVGKHGKTGSELVREDARAVRDAAFRRAAEALRALSEYGKTIDPGIAAELEALRYETYAFESIMQADNAIRGRLSRSLLYVLVTTEFCRADPLTTTREALAGGADIIQFREKTMEDGEFHRLAGEMAALCRERDALLVINDRPHIAVLTGASGVHGGQGDLPVHLTRRLIGPERMIGCSTSRPELAEKALSDGADYIGVGPVYETATKAHRSAVGTEYVAWAAAWDKLPFFAIGSVNRGTIDSVIEAGAKRAAICTAVTMAQDVSAETAFFRERLILAKNR
jgi:thiamine-phosphate pyrophosphorylase